MWSLTWDGINDLCEVTQGSFPRLCIFEYAWNLLVKESRDLFIVSLQILFTALEFSPDVPRLSCTVTRVCVGELRVEVLIRRLRRRQLLLQTQSRHQLLEENACPVTVAAQAAHNVIR